MKLFALFIGIVALILFLFPINLFEGEIVFELNGNRFTENAKLSLSYFIGIGASASETKDVVDFNLLPLGFLNVFFLLFCLPLLISYRFYLNDLKKGGNIIK
ncbi:MAG: hypothetical protein HYU67_06975 [Flavobacteriia bacterium]|nr:hypothetical protein [Flavobacteriia bacterium]